MNDRMNLLPPPFRRGGGTTLRPPFPPMAPATDGADEQRFEDLQQTDERQQVLIEDLDGREKADRADIDALKARPDGGGRWSDYLGRLSSRRFQAFLVGALTPIAAMVSGNLDVRAGVAAVFAAVVAWLTSEGAVDAAARLKGKGN